MIYFVTKYALTKGIQRVAAEQSGATMLYWRDDNGHGQFAHKPYWHESEQAAVDHAVWLREATILSHKRFIDKLEKLNFVVSA